MKKKNGFLTWQNFSCDVVGFVKSYSMEQLEDEYDKQTAEIAHKRWIEQGKETISMDEILNEFGGL